MEKPEDNLQSLTALAELYEDLLNKPVTNESELMARKEQMKVLREQLISGIIKTKKAISKFKPC